MTSDSDSTSAQLRRQNGRDKPWKVPTLPSEMRVGVAAVKCARVYADEYRRYATLLKTTPQPHQKLAVRIAR